MIVKAVIFDFDGPINDSFREGLRRIEVLCKTNDVPFNRITRQRLISLWGIPGVHLLEQGLEIPMELANVIYPKWEIWDITDPIPLVPGAREALRWNRKHGVVNTLLTSRNDEHLRDLLDKLDLSDRETNIGEFTVIQARSKTSYSKPDPRVFEYTLSELQKRGIKKEECVFVGDTPEDIKTGNAAGVEMIVALTGPYWVEHVLNFPVKQENIIPSIDYLPEWMFKHAENIEI